MTVKERISVRLNTKVRNLLEKKCPNANRSLLINNAFDYILSQDDDFILEFCKKP